MTTLSLNGLSVDQQLAQFVEQQLLPGTGINTDTFWQGFADIVNELTPINRALCLWLE